MNLNLKMILAMGLVGFSLAARAQNADELAAAANPTQQVSIALPANVVFTSTTGQTKLQASTSSTIMACTSAATTAQSYCFTENPKIRGAMAGLGGVLSIIKTSKLSGAKACEKYSEAMNITETALTAYNAACAWAQSECESECTKAEAALANDATVLKGSIMTVTIDGGVEAKKAEIDLQKVFGSKGGVHNTIKQCAGYKFNMAAAALGLRNVLAQIGQSVSCKTATTVDCTVDKYNAACRSVVDCGKAENQNQTACICQRSPNSPGCAGYTGQSIAGQAATSTNNVNAFERGSGTYTPSSSDSIPVVAGNASISGSAPSSGLMGSAGSGSGSSGTSGIAGASAKTSGADATKNKGYNTNILSGGDGGGGVSASSTGRSVASQDSQYGAYIPGAAKDPTASKTTSTSSNDITGSGSKSNWEKIREVYSAKQTSLIGN